MQNTNLSEQIRKLRQSKKFTLAVMAERLGVTTSAVAAYENGTRNPSFEVLVKISKIFNVTVDSLLSFGVQDKINVSDLTPTQRDNVQNMILTYRKFNQLVTTAFDWDRYGVKKEEIKKDLEEFIDLDFDDFEHKVLTHRQNRFDLLEYKIEDLNDEIKELKKQI